MYFNGTITYKGVQSSTHSLLITEVPTIIHSQIRGDTAPIPGKDGDAVSTDTYRGDAQVRVNFALIKETGNYYEAIRGIREWLTGTGTLVIGDATDSYYEVKKVEINTDERIIVNVGTVEVVFTVYPYEFLNSGDTGISGGGTVANSNSKSCPLYKIVGNGTGTLTVNGNTMDFTVATADEGIYIDTRRHMAYNGKSTPENKNGSLTGDYDAIKLVHGNNSIAISSGFTLTTYPKWGYTI